MFQLATPTASSGVLFAALHLGGAGHVIGIEMNKELCDLQNAAVAAFQSTLMEAAVSSSSSSSAEPSAAPITIMHTDVAAALPTLHHADVIVCHIKP
jgi:hypothetical protein